MSYFFVKFISIILFLAIICKYKSKNNIRYIKDVLFVSGYEQKKNSLSYKYHILSQIEELNASFIESDEYFYLNFEPSFVSDYRVIIFSGCPLIGKVKEAIILAKNLNKKIIFDIDGFVIDKKRYKNKFLFNNFSLNENKLYNH